MNRDQLLHGSAQPGDRAPADGPLRLVQDFVNTVDMENVVELFDAPAGLAHWLAVRGLPGGAAPGGPAAADVDAAALRRALKLREALRVVLLANTGHAGDTAAARDGLTATAAREVLTATAARAKLRADFATAPPRFVAAASGVDAALGSIVAVAFAAMLNGSWGRLKACPRDVCRWAFYDRSPNNRATWCSMSVCGNRTKAGTYYRRRTRAQP